MSVLSLGGMKNPHGASRLRALIVDDDEGILRLLKMVLDKRGWIVLAVGSPKHLSMPSGRHGRCDVDRPCYDLIISDVHMPDMSGIDFFAILRRDACKCRNAFLISGACTSDEVVSAHKQGFELMPKPLDIEAFNRRVEAVERQAMAAG